MCEQKLEKIYILCGLSNEGSDEIKTAIKEAAKEKGYEAICVSRYRKEGICQYISEHKEFRTLVLQEAMQTNYPYTAEELAELSDDYHLNIVISIKKSHKADRYMKILYTAGILNALYEEDASAVNIIDKILCPRTHKECREYYQIQTASDAMRVLEIIDTERLNGYLTYLDEALDEEELKHRYYYITENLKPVENLYLIKELPEKVTQVLKTDEVYQNIINLQEKKKSWFFGKKKKANPMQEQKVQIPMCPTQVEDIEKPVMYEKEQSIDELLEEDISDLLGFCNTDDFISQQTIGIQSTSVLEIDDEKQERMSIQKGERVIENQKKNKESIPFTKIILAVVVVLFFAFIILFGFFLYSEAQKKESSKPVIYQQSQYEREDNIGMDKKENLEIMSEEQKYVEEIKKKEKMAQESKERDFYRQCDEKKETSEMKSKKVYQQNEEKGQQVQVNQVTQQVQNPPMSVEQNSQVSIETQFSEEPTEETEEQKSEIYNGQILTGTEVKQIAQKEESKGARLYLRTRQNGEGYYNALQIVSLIDDSCSYLLQGNSGGEISFIQQ